MEACIRVPNGRWTEAFASPVDVCHEARGSSQAEHIYKASKVEETSKKYPTGPEINKQHTLEPKNIYLKNIKNRSCQRDTKTEEVKASHGSLRMKSQTSKVGQKLRPNLYGRSASVLVGESGQCVSCLLFDSSACLSGRLNDTVHWYLVDPQWLGKSYKAVKNVQLSVFHLCETGSTSGLVLLHVPCSLRPTIAALERQENNLNNKQSIDIVYQIHVWHAHECRRCLICN